MLGLKDCIILYLPSLPRIEIEPFGVQTAKRGKRTLKVML